MEMSDVLVEMPDDVIKTVEEFANDYVQNVVLYFLTNDNTAYLHTHVYRVNGVIEAKQKCDGEMMQPFCPPTELALQSFVRRCGYWQYVPSDRVMVVYRGKALPPMAFESPRGVWLAIRNHFRPVMQQFEMLEETLAEESDMDPIARFGEYAWELLNQKDD